MNYVALYRKEDRYTCQHLMCSKYVFHELFIAQHVQGEAVGGPAAIEDRIRLAVQEGVIAVINSGLCVC